MKPPDGINPIEWILLKAAIYLTQGKEEMSLLEEAIRLQRDMADRLVPPIVDEHPYYHYVALDASGNEVKGTTKAASRQEALSNIRRKGYFPTQLENIPTRTTKITIRRTEPLPDLKPTKKENRLITLIRNAIRGPKKDEPKKVDWEAECKRLIVVIDQAAAANFTSEAANGVLKEAVNVHRHNFVDYMEKTDGNSSIP
jgi:hypothetical protein